MGEFADDFLGAESDGGDGKPEATTPSDQSSSSSNGNKQGRDTRVQGFVLVGDLLVGKKAGSIEAPVHLGNIADVARLCSVSFPPRDGVKP